MHFFTFGEKDTTLYQNSGSLNAGLDEILEIRKEVSDSGDAINILESNLFNFNKLACDLIIKKTVDSKYLKGLNITYF